MTGVVLALAGLACGDGGPGDGGNAPVVVRPEGEREGALALADIRHLVLVVPATWFAGHHPWSPPVRQSDVVALLGSPDSAFTSGWRERWGYRRLGLGFEWERRVCAYCPADEFGPVARAAFRALAAGPARALVTLLEAHYMPAERLAGVSWSAWWLTYEWRWE